MERIQTKVIGYWMSEKKSLKLNWSEFAEVCRAQGYELVKLDLTRSLEDQGPFTAIVHKLSDIIIAASLRNNPKAISMLKYIEDYIQQHPEVVIIDPFENVRKVVDRFRSYWIIRESNLHSVDVFTPSFVELVSTDKDTCLRALKWAGVTFPFVCKPSVANGADCHKMAIVFNEDGLRDCVPPCVAHSFVNHNAILYKLFIIGDEYHVVERPSIKNLKPDPNQKTIHFYSHEVSRSDSQSHLSILDEEDVEIRKADKSILDRIVSTLREDLGMSLLGIDVVVENTTGRHAIIDINAYPGYDGFPGFFDSLLRCIQLKVAEHSKKTMEGSLSNSPSTNTIFPNEQEDSGFETADSSDEKKRNSKCSPPLTGLSLERHF